MNVLMQNDLSRCALCGSPGIAQTEAKTSLCAEHWDVYRNSWRARLSEEQQHLLALGAQLEYPDVRIWPHMRLLSGRQHYEHFCRWHLVPADTHQALEKLEEIRMAFARHEAEVVIDLPALARA